jgi:hypothetical protein
MVQTSWTRRIALIAAGALMLYTFAAAVASSAAEIKVLTSVALTSAFNEVAPNFDPFPHWSGCPPGAQCQGLSTRIAIAQAQQISRFVFGSTDWRRQGQDHCGLARPMLSRRRTHAIQVHSDDGAYDLIRLPKLIGLPA